MATPYRIELFGALRVSVGSETITRFRTQKAGALLAFFALHLDQTHTRERLIDLFWPEMDMESGRVNLSTNLSSLRRQVEASLPAGSLLVADRQTVRLNAAQISTDLGDFDRLLSQARGCQDPRARAGLLEEAAGLYRGDLLPGLYDDWALQEQARCRERLGDALLQLSWAREQLADAEGALEAIQRAVRVDPMREEAQHAQMRLLACLGRAHAALTAYADWEALLEAEMGAAPSQELCALAAELRRNPDAMAVRSAVAAGPPNNLPVQPTSFIGREREMEEVKGLLQRTHLLTLTGSGGCGKTRLALEVAGRMLERYPDGVWLVELAALAAAALLPQRAAAVFGLKEEPGKPILQTLKDYLKGRSLLLLLDNCEHLLDACGQLADTLLRSCPGVVILASSRAGMGIEGETTYRVPSLTLPDPTRDTTAELLGGFEAARLFVERAVQVKTLFTVTNQDAPALASICCRLDGIPLAIELAAARVRAMPVQQIEQRLDQRFRLLTGGSRTMLPRQQTLRSLIDWSYDLLSETEKALLGRLSVFSGGWTLEAAEQACRGETIEEWEVLDLLTSLSDKSLVIYQESEGAARYRLLETVRQYARDRLVESGEGEAWRDRHLAHFLALAVETEPNVAGADQQTWLDRLETEHDNLRAALDWSCRDAARAEAGLQLAVAIWPFWEVRGHYSEGRERLSRALELGRSCGAKTRSSALNAAGVLAYRQGDYPAARSLQEESLAIVRELGDRRGIAALLGNLGNVANVQGDYLAARSLYEESLAIVRELGDRRSIATSLNNLGGVARVQGDYLAARSLQEESLAIVRELGDRRSIANSLNNLGNVADNQGDFAAARSLHEESLAIKRELGDRRGIAYSLCNLGLAAYNQGDYPAARSLHEESLVILCELGDRLGIGYSVAGIARLDAKQGNVAQAACLWGAVGRLREEIGTRLSTGEQDEQDRDMAAARQALGEEAVAAAWAEGRAMTLEQAIERALAGARP